MNHKRITQPIGLTVALLLVLGASGNATELPSAWQELIGSQPEARPATPRFPRMRDRSSWC
jgi:hypothetical protein